MAVSNDGIICERLTLVVEAAVEGRWALYADICASERAVIVRPWRR
jgi:hypothetical protein